MREKLLTPVWSPSLADLIPEAQFAHRRGWGRGCNIFVLAYNTKLVRKAELPEA